MAVSVFVVRNIFPKGGLMEVMGVMEGVSTWLEMKDSTP
jgi:hypothetical protein